jgi:hypothetical protein
MNRRMNGIDESSSRPPARPDLDAWTEALRAAESRRATHGFTARGGADGDPAGLWTTTLRWCLAVAVACALAWLTYTRDGWIPLLSGADLGVHEFGHLVFFWSPVIWEQFAGSFMQVALPLVVCLYFWRRGDRPAAIVTLAWAAESLNNVSVYIHDATRMVLPLFNDDGSGSGHDWHNILGELGLLGHTDQITALVRGLSVTLFLVALGLAVRGLVRARTI